MITLLRLLQAYVYRFNSYLRCYNLSAPAEELSLIRPHRTLQKFVKQNIELTGLIS